MTTYLGFLIFGTRGLVDGRRWWGRGSTQSERFERVSESRGRLLVRGWARVLHADQRTCQVHEDTLGPMKQVRSRLGRTPRWMTVPRDTILMLCSWCIQTRQHQMESVLMNAPFLTSPPLNAVSATSFFSCAICSLDATSVCASGVTTAFASSGTGRPASLGADVAVVSLDCSDMTDPSTRQSYRMKKIASPKTSAGQLELICLCCPPFHIRTSKSPTLSVLRPKHSPMALLSTVLGFSAFGLASRFGQLAIQKRNLMDSAFYSYNPVKHIFEMLSLQTWLDTPLPWLYLDMEATGYTTTKYEQMSSLHGSVRKCKAGRMVREKQELQQLDVGQEPAGWAACVPFWHRFVICALDSQWT